MSNFKVGDVVEFSGQEMTITEITGGQCVCQWFDGKNQLQTGKFPSASLKKPPDPMEVVRAVGKFM